MSQCLYVCILTHLKNPFTYIFHIHFEVLSIDEILDNNQEVQQFDSDDTPLITSYLQPVEGLPDQELFDDDDYEVESGNDLDDLFLQKRGDMWKFRSGKRAKMNDWKFRGGKRADLWKFRGGKRADLWKFRGGKRADLWKFRGGKRADLWKFRGGKRSDYGKYSRSLQNAISLISQ